MTASAWAAWAAGDVDLAQALALDALAAQQAPDDARHLLVLTSIVRGDYRGGLDHYRSIAPSYRRAAQLADPVIDAYLHLGEIAEAAAFARAQRRVPSTTVQRLEAHVRRPMFVDLAAVTAVPFADHPLTEYLPAFDVEINGRPVAAHVDTGGPFLLMGPDRAAALGIETVRVGSSRAHLNLMRVQTSYGIADRLVLGDAVLHNVPVDVLSSLRGAGDLIIFGTNVLQRFLSTFDYPGRRLILSPRGDGTAARAHAAMLPAEQVTVPFYLWSDHFMFARGGIGARRDLNFFVDSGLVSLHPDGNGGTRQASFTSSKRRLKEFGIARGEINRLFFEFPARLTLGPLAEDRPMVVVGAAGDQNFGGVRIDGLISHAFLSRYVWTIDFDSHEYRFAPGCDRLVPSTSTPGDSDPGFGPLVLTEGLRPSDSPTGSLAGAPTPRSARQAHSLPLVRAICEIASSLSRGTSSPGPPYTLSRSPLRRLAPFAWLARYARSHSGTSGSLDQLLVDRCRHFSRNDAARL